MSFRRRTFPELLENLLTAMTGGVTAESHPFPPPGATGPPYRHQLQQPPVAKVISVNGSRDGQPHLFRPEVDYALVQGQPVLEWKEGAELPDAGSLVDVNYYPSSAEPVLTDLHVGSVLRTLAESVGLEIARLYAQLEAVYLSGFVDTATGRALDNVVALLGIERIRGGRATGEIQFTRSPGTRGTINIPAGTRVMTADGEVLYETTEAVTLGPDQSTLRVAARDLEEGNDPLPADQLTVLPIPIAGIGSVANPAPTALTTQDETDDELRTRAKSFLYGSERATLGAIRQAINLQGVAADVEEVPDHPGFVEITPHTESMPPELMQRLLAAKEEARPAGVVVTLKEPQAPRKVNLEIRLTTASGLLEQDLRAAQRAVREKLVDYFARLPAGAEGSINRIVGLALSVPQVEDLRLLSATCTADGSTQDVLDLANGRLSIGGFTTVLGELRLVDPNLPTLLNAVVSYPQGQAPPDPAGLRGALTGMVTYLNNLNASELPSDASPAEVAKRVLSYGRLLYAVPLPGQPARTLQEYDGAAAGGAAPTLPDETTVAPYQVQFVFTQTSGLSRTLSKQADSVYTLTAFERLSLAGAEVEASHG